MVPDGLPEFPASAATVAVILEVVLSAVVGAFTLVTLVNPGVIAAKTPSTPWPIAAVMDKEYWDRKSIGPESQSVKALLMMASPSPFRTWPAKFPVAGSRH
jgi:hypothetical protein